MQSEPSTQLAAPKKGKSIWPFFILGILLILLFWGINKWALHSATSDTDPEEIERSAFRAKTLAELQAENKTKLETYAWVDRSKGSVQIPIREAMELVVTELNAKPPHPAYPIAPPANATPASTATPTPTP